MTAVKIECQIYNLLVISCTTGVTALAHNVTCAST